MTSGLPTAPVEIDGYLFWRVGERLFPFVSGAAEGDDPPAGDPPAGDPPAGDPPADDDGDGSDGPPVVSMSQADLDALISKRIGQARKGWDKEISDAAEAARLTDAQRAERERDAAQRAADEKVTGANQRLLSAEAKVAALAAGVDPKRVARFLRNVDLDVADMVDDDGTVDEAAVAAAVTAALADVPEFKGTAGPAGPSGASHNGSGDQPTSFTREQIAKMSVEEFNKNRDAILAAQKAGTIR